MYLTRKAKVDAHLSSRLQIGAYDQQMWEKSVEQREIKVGRFGAGFSFRRPRPFSLARGAHFRLASLSFILFSVTGVFVSCL